MSHLEVIGFLLDRVNNGEPAGLWAVVEHEGSSPGRAGFLMAVSAGATAGTIGGGIMEAELVDRARLWLGEGSSETILIDRVHRDQAPAEKRSGLICSGAQRMVYCPVKRTDAELLQQVRDALSANLAVRLSLGNSGIAALVQEELAEETPPSFTGSATGFRFDAWIGPRHTVYVFGSGHIGLAVCHALAPLDFHVVAFDDRPELEQVRRNRHAHEMVTGNYSGVRSHVRGGCRTYGVVVTAQRDHDTEVLRQVAGLPFRYLGVMGSRAKLAAIRRSLVDSGVNAQHIERIRGPIGVEIGAETPAEIAAAIVAELIKVRREG